MLFIITYASFLLPGTCDNSSEFGTHVLQFFWTSAFTVFSHLLAFYATDTASAEERCNFGLKSSTRFNVHVPAFFQACTEKQWHGWEPPITIIAIYSLFYANGLHWTNNSHVFFNHIIINNELYDNNYDYASILSLL